MGEVRDAANLLYDDGSNSQTDSYQHMQNVRHFASSDVEKATSHSVTQTLCQNENNYAINLTWLPEEGVASGRVAIEHAATERRQQTRHPAGRTCSPTPGRRCACWGHRIVRARWRRTTVQDGSWGWGVWKERERSSSPPKQQRPEVAPNRQRSG